MEISVRNAEINDMESIVELSSQLGSKIQVLAFKNRFKQILENANNCVYVAIENENVVGWLHGFYAFRIQSECFVEIGGLVVCGKVRKKGIGKKLIDQAIKWTKLKNCKNIRVRCNVIRIESLKFYENIGFEVRKEQKVLNRRVE